MVRSPASLFPDETTSASQSGWVIAHCDGGARGNPGPAGYGALLQDEAGAVLAELSEFLGNRTNNYAEYSGLLGCLQWALDHGHRRLRVISDSELMVKQIQGKYKVNSPDLRPLWEEARRRIAQLDRFEISHALRHKNKAADQLANDAMDRGTNRQRATAESVNAHFKDRHHGRSPTHQQPGFPPNERSSSGSQPVHAARLYTGRKHSPARRRGSSRWHLRQNHSGMITYLPCHRINLRK